VRPLSRFAASGRVSMVLSKEARLTEHATDITGVTFAAIAAA